MHVGLVRTWANFHCRVQQNAMALDNIFFLAWTIFIYSFYGNFKIYLIRKNLHSKKKRRSKTQIFELFFVL